MHQLDAHIRAFISGQTDVADRAIKGKPIPKLPLDHPEQTLGMWLEWVQTDFTVKLTPRLGIHGKIALLEHINDILGIQDCRCSGIFNGGSGFGHGRSFRLSVDGRPHRPP